MSDSECSFSDDILSSHSEDTILEYYSSDSSVEGDSIPYQQWCRSAENFSAPPRFMFTGNPGVKVAITEKSLPLECFELFFDDELIHMITRETNLHARECLPKHTSKCTSLEKRWHDTTPEEIRIFLGLIMLQSIVWKPNEQWYWSKNKMIETPFFRKVMIRDRFYSIMKYLHFTDNATFDEEHHLNPKLKKLYEVYIYLVQKFQICYIPECDISVDESLLLFKGRPEWKQYIPKKRADFGMKLCMIAESCSGYVWNFLVYTGSGARYNSTYGKFTSPTQVVMTLMQPLLGQGYCVTTDNFYTSPELCDLLISHQTDIYGTARIRRKQMPPNLKNVKLEKGEWIAYQRGKLMCLLWKDKKYICLLSTIHNATINTIITPRSKVAVQKPQVIIDYSNTIGGRDRCDQNMSTYDPTRKYQKKNCKKVFRHFMDLSIWNAFILLKKAGGNMEFLSFRMKLVEEIIMTYCVLPSTSRAHHSGMMAIAPVRLCKGGHFPKYVPATEKKASPVWRCVVCSRKRDAKGKKVRKETRFCCLDCKVGLCVIPCFELYHTKADLYFYA